jgi:hypothetical protein
MKVKHLLRIGDRNFIRFVTDASPDPEGTKVKIAELLNITEKELEEAADDVFLAMANRGMPDNEIKKTYNENLVYVENYGLDAETIDDEEGDQIQEKLEALGERRLLEDTLEYVANNIGVEYCMKKSGRWTKEKIEEIDIDLPAGAVLQENLTPEQQQEISAQKEADRIAGLSPEKKAEEKSAKLHALAREANNKEADAELLDEPFDKRAWLLPKKQEVERLYA